MNDQMSLLDDGAPAKGAEHPQTQPVKWARYVAAGQGYELSSHGDKRFSALYARLRDGRSIEEAYQLDVKGYRTQGNDWRLGKGKPALDGRPPEQLWEGYLGLWQQWAQENPAVIDDLAAKSAGKVLTDKFASSPVSQARALAQILTERVDANAAPARPRLMPR